jgi:uncharacterized protein (DUF362 family)
VRAKDSSINAVKKAIEESLDLIHFSLDENTKTIAIKPNICYYFLPSTGEITDPRFVRALIEVLRQRCSSDPEILVVESDASAMKCGHSFKMLGYQQMAEENNVRLVNLTDEKSRLFDVRINDWYMRFSIPEVLLGCDLFVNVPKMKYMRRTKITCALKNVYGCNANPRKSTYHIALSEAIVAMNKLIRTGLVVVDGLIVAGKNTKRLNLVMASRDLVAVDAAASQLMGMDPASVDLIALASREGIGNLEFTTIGEHAFIKRAFPKKGFREKTWEIAASVYLRLMHRE